MMFNHNKKKQKKILVIDDDPSIALVLKEFLESKGYLVSSSSITQANHIDELLLREKPDLVFLDYRMSPLTGKDILERINIRGLSIPVVMMSAYRTREGAFEVKNLGAIEYIGKPFDFSEIDSVLKKVFS